jgi:hypothetical protein
MHEVCGPSSLSVVHLKCKWNYVVVQVHAWKAHSRSVGGKRLKLDYISVGIASRYRLGGLEIESRRGRDFPHSSKQSEGPTQPPVKWVPSLVSPGVTRSGRGVNFLPPSSTKVKERVELHLLSPSVPYWQVIGWTLALLPIALTNSCCCLVRWCSGTFAELYSRGAQFDPRLGKRLTWMRVLVVFFGPSKPRSFVSNFRQTCCAVDRYVTQRFWSKVSWDRV